MIEYQLKDSAGETFALNGSTVSRELKGSLTFGADEFENDSEIIENSFLPGAQLIGSPRLTSRSVNLTFNSTSPDSSTFRSEINEIMEFVNRTRYIVDVTNDMELDVVLSNGGIDYDAGSLKQLSECSFRFMVLSPSWRALTADHISGTVTKDKLTTVSVNNGGFLDTPPIITLEAAGPVPNLQVFVYSSQEGIQITDALFGTAGNETMVIDCGAGTVTIGDVNRNLSIGSGTGFFRLPVGADQLQMLFADYSVDYTVDFYKRYFI